MRMSGTAAVGTGGPGLAFGKLGEEVGVDQIDGHVRANHSDAVSYAGLRHRGAIDDFDGLAGLLPLGDGVVGQTASEKQHAFVLPASANARAQPAQASTAGGGDAWTKRNQTLRRTKSSTTQRLDVDGAIDALHEGGRAKTFPLEKNPRHRLERRRAQLAQTLFQRCQRALAKRSAGLAEHIFGLFQVGVWRATGQRKK